MTKSRQAGFSAFAPVVVVVILGLLAKVILLCSIGSVDRF